MQPAQGPVWGRVQRVLPLFTTRRTPAVRGLAAQIGTALPMPGAPAVTAFVSGELGIPLPARPAMRLRSPESLFDRLPAR
jgi:hypothetical protein